MHFLLLSLDVSGLFSSRLRTWWASLRHVHDPYYQSNKLPDMVQGKGEDGKRQVKGLTKYTWLPAMYTEQERYSNGIEWNDPEWYLIFIYLSLQNPALLD